MYLTHLSLTNFRNFARLDIDIPRGAVILVGDNAQGKTSLLEAIYYLSSLVSFHTSSNRQLINFLITREQLAVARIKATFKKSGDTHQMEVRLIQKNNKVNGISRVRKEILMDGVKRKTNDVVGEFNAVLFLPQMLRIVEGSPRTRRHYLDLTLSQVVPRYASALNDYNRALTQRNALLKQISENREDAQQLSFWDQSLAKSGAKIMFDRIKSIRELEQLASRAHDELSGGDEVLRISYVPAYDPLAQPDNQYEFKMDAPINRSGLSQEEIEEGFRECLVQLRSEEIARGVTTIGPHRDEMRFLSNRIDLGIYGSRGQIRTAMLALKLAEVNWMKEKSGHWPVLLLDEVLAELDDQHRTDLLSSLVTSEQAILTTTDINLFPEDFVEMTAMWRIQDGCVVGTV